MKRPYPGLPPLVAALTTFLDNIGRVSIVDATLDDIRAARARVYPTTPPFSWITGRVPADVTIDDGSAPERDGASIPLRWYTPAGRREDRPLLVYLHGGGWVQGSTRMYDPLCTHLAAELDAVVGTRPVYLARIDEHSAVASTALRRLIPDLADAVALGLLPGESTPLQVDAEPLPESPAHALDADEAGVTLLRVRDGETTAVHVALPGAGRLDHSPRHAWRRLLDAIPARVAHP